MNLWRNLLGKKDPQKKEEAQSPFLPKQKDPIEIEFVKNFTRHGGRFIFVESQEMLFNSFENILKENTWEPKHICCLHKDLAQYFNISTSEEFTNRQQYSALLTTCESLIANKGGFLVCQHQIKNIKLKELPEYIIVFATLNQLTSDVSEAMSILKQKYDRALPTNITNLSVKNETKDKQSLTQGSNAKNIYLLLQE